MNIQKKHLWGLLGFTLLLRLLSLDMYPLMDTTEARYGEMARLMVETGNWLTPQFDYGIPFWGKPPLFVWSSALGVEMLGLSEFALRLPHWLAGVATLGIMAWFAKRLGYSSTITTTVLASCLVFLISSGTIMTDMLLTLGMTIAMVGFYLCWEQPSQNKYWGYIGFVGLAIGLLAKGPVIIVLMALAITPWIIFYYGLFNSFKQLWQRIPLVTGGLLMLAIALPWYVLAEQATEGFLDYFIIGEHFKRFTDSGWQGDLYGVAHDEPRGKIWLFWLIVALPWSFVLPSLLWRRYKQTKLPQPTNNENKLLFFLLFWLVAPMLLFTMAGNILPTYILPGIPALGLLIAMLTQRADYRWLMFTAATSPVILLSIIIWLNMGFSDKKSDAAIFEKTVLALPTFYINQRPFSGQFYSYGQAKLLTQHQSLPHHQAFYLIGKADPVSSVIQARHLECEIKHTASSMRILYQCYKP